MPNIEQMIQDLMKGAARVERQPDCGHEEKLALDQSTLLGGIPFVGPSLAGLSAAAHEGHVGPGMLASSGAGLGQIGGGLTGGALGALGGQEVGRMVANMKNDRLPWYNVWDHVNPNEYGDTGAMIGSALGGLGGVVGGGMLGSGAGRAVGEHPEAALTQAKEAGAQAAFTQYKVANFLGGMAGMGAQLLGGPMFQRGLQAASGWAAKKGLGRVAPLLSRGANYLGGSGIGSQLANAGAGAVAGSAVDSLVGN